jgi:excisionase family DNA binding protein
MSSRLLADFLTFDELAKDLGRHPRTIVRWTRQQDGLPYVAMGKTKLIHISEWQKWLLSRTKRPNPTRGRRR